MADKEKFDDEYHFDDADAFNPDVLDVPLDTEDDAHKKNEENINTPQSFGPKNKVRRNALIVAAAVLALVVIYELVSSFFTGDKIPKAPVTSIKTAKKIAQEYQAETAAQLTTTPQAENNLQIGTESNMQKQLDRVQQSEQNVRTEVVTINNQVTGMNNNLQSMMTRISELNQAVEKLSMRVEEQSHVIEQLMMHAKPKRVHSKASIPMQSMPKFFIQAVIPGRAWLIAPNGATLTVREGTSIQGYGIVKLIDPIQGRVMTSSGQVIRFSQEDS